MADLAVLESIAGIDNFHVRKIALYHLQQATEKLVKGYGLALHDFYAMTKESKTGKLMEPLLSKIISKDVKNWFSKLIGMSQCPSKAYHDPVAKIFGPGNISNALAPLVNSINSISELKLPLDVDLERIYKKFLVRVKQIFIWLGQSLREKELDGFDKVIQNVELLQREDC